MLETVFVLLYPLVFLIGLAGYIPQIVRLVRDDSPALNISLMTWFIWTFATAISLGYGITKLHDVMFCVVTATNLLAHMLIIMLVIYRRRTGYVKEPLSHLSAAGRVSVSIIP